MPREGTGNPAMPPDPVIAELAGLIGDPAERNLHSLGGVLEMDDLNGAIRLRERHHVGPVCLRTNPRQLTRIASDYSEFHCALVRRSVLARIGPFDENGFR